MSDPHAVLPLLHESSAHLTRTVDALTTDDWAAPSLLPGWSRAYVVAHLALNAEALTRALHGAVAGDPAPMYASQDARDRDIDELAVAGHAELRDRLLAGTTRVHDAIAAVPPEQWDASAERVPGGPTFALGAVAGMRWREVEIHHADLGTAYTHADWSPAFATALIDGMVDRARGSSDASSDGFAVHAADLGRTWTFGAETPVVTGTASSLGWWLTGRGEGHDLTTDSGVLPQIGAW
ncbi:unannotated protein [freshwater metagenome]|uniref:Unannotated protein n=1 Tax=freshwater metagenome TaxID=449393 RepID=A0A6J6NP65_9ZZZZ